MSESVYKVKHIPTGRYYRGSTSRYGMRNSSDTEYINKIFSVSGKTYSKLSWAKSATRNLQTYGRWKNTPWSESDFEIIEFKIIEIGKVKK